MKNIKYLLLFLIGLNFISCDKFLAERPSKSSNIVPTTVEDMETILAGIWREDCISPNLAFATDDVGLYSDLERRKPNTYDLESTMAALFDRDLSLGLYMDYMWMYRYQNIFRSNLVFSRLSIIDCSEEEKTRLKAKASWRRAYSYMELANLYTLPYCEANLNELGLVLKSEVGFDTSLKRATIKETYDFIEADILAALKINTKLENKFGEGSVNRVTNASANALAARFYLTKHDYANAKKYAQQALDLYGTNNIMDYNSLGYHSKVESGKIIIDEVEIVFTVKYPITEAGYDFTNEWTENYYIGNYHGSDLPGHCPSPELLECFDADGAKEEDQRFKYFFIENHLYLNNYPLDVPYFDKGNYMNYTITVPEMLLIVAECEARAGDYNEGINLINQLRIKRIDTRGEVNLTATDKDDAIATVLRERRRELCFTMRLYDLRRYNSNDYDADDVTITKKFYEYNAISVNTSSAIKTYVIKPGDRRYACLIPEGDILAGEGVLEQNKY